jgi:AraC family carnitine catabolism transcriptional activator
MVGKPFPRAGALTVAQLITFLLIPGFSLLDFAAVAEPLRSANRLAGPLYRWQVLSQHGAAVMASNGMTMAVDGALCELGPSDTLFVVAAYDPLQHMDPPLKHWLRRQDSAGATLGAIDTGAFLLAEAGLLRDYRLTLHWEALDAFEEQYPGLKVSEELFEIDRRRITSAGGTASMDLMLELIGRAHGRELASRVAEQFVLGRIRPQQDRQRTELAQRYKVHNRKLLMVIERMQQALEAPLSLDALASDAGVTRRHLERLFSTWLQEAPGAFYQRLRLDKARQLLQQSDLNVLQISLACGFDSPSYFARCYRERFACTPRQDRVILAGRAAAS